MLFPLSTFLQAHARPASPVHWQQSDTGQALARAQARVSERSCACTRSAAARMAGTPASAPDDGHAEFERHAARRPAPHEHVRTRAACRPAVRRQLQRAARSPAPASLQALTGAGLEAEARAQHGRVRLLVRQTPRQLLQRVLQLRLAQVVRAPAAADRHHHLAHRGHLVRIGHRLRSRLRSSACRPAGRARHSAAGGLGRWRAWSARLHLQGRDCVLEPRAEGLLGRQLAADGREQHLRLRVLRLVHRRQALQRLAPARVVGGLARAAQVVRLLARHWCCWELAEATGKRPRQQSCPVSLGCLRKGLLLLSCCLLARVWGGYAGCTDFISDGARSGAALQHRRRLKLSAAGRLTAATVDGSCFRDTLGSAGLKWDTLAREGCQAQSVAGTTSASTSAHLACQYPHALCDCCTPVAARSCAHSPPTWSGALRLRAPRRLASLHWPVTGATLASEGARSLREEAPRDDGQCPFAEAGAQLAGACACAGRCPSAPSPVRLRSGRG